MKAGWPKELEDRPTIHIGLLWHSLLSENLGVGALTIANAYLIAAAVGRVGYRPVFHIIGVRGTHDYTAVLPFENSFVNVGYKAMVNPLSGLHRHLRRCDIVFDIGAGDSFSDIYRWSRLNLILASKVAVRIARAPLIFSPQTIGPFFSKPARIAAKGVLALADAIFARDETSLALLKTMGFGDKASLATDVAFALPFTAPADKAGRDLLNGPIKVGVNVSALLYRRELSRGDRIALALDYPALIDAILQRLSDDPRIELHIVPHVVNSAMDHENDSAVSEMLKTRFATATIAPPFGDPLQAKNYIAGLDLLIGSRLHATIAAISSGTAAFPLGYSRKFNGLFGSLGYELAADLTQDSQQTVLARLNDVLGNLASVRQAALAANAKAQQRLALYSEFLDRTIAEMVVRNA